MPGAAEAFSATKFTPGRAPGSAARGRNLSGHGDKLNVRLEML